MDAELLAKYVQTGFWIALSLLCLGLALFAVADAIRFGVATWWGLINVATAVLSVDFGWRLYRMAVLAANPK